MIASFWRLITPHVKCFQICIYIAGKVKSEMHADSEQLLIEIWLLNSETEFSLSYNWLWDKFFKKGWNSGSLTPMRVLCPKVNEGQHSVGVLGLERLVASLIAVLKLLHIRTSWRACLNTDDWVSPPIFCFSKSEEGAKNLLFQRFPDDGNLLSWGSQLF